MDYIIQSVHTNQCFTCPKVEAWFWAMLNDDYFLTLSYNIYKQGGSMFLNSKSDIANDKSTH